MHLKQVAIMLIGGGVLLALAGLMLLLASKLGIPLGRLPGDIQAEGKGWSIHFPIVTCMVVSLLLTLIINFFMRR